MHDHRVMESGILEPGCFIGPTFKCVPDKFESGHGTGRDDGAGFVSTKKAMMYRWTTPFSAEVNSALPDAYALKSARQSCASYRKQIPRRTSEKERSAVFRSPKRSHFRLHAIQRPVHVSRLRLLPWTTVNQLSCSMMSTSLATIAVARVPATGGHRGRSGATTWNGKVDLRRRLAIGSSAIEPP